MLKNDLEPLSEALLDRMTDDGYSQQILGKSRWVLGLFCQYCKRKGIESISLSNAADFVGEHFDFDLYNPSIPIQYAIRYPLLTLFEFDKNGTYAKTHNKPNSVEIPRNYDALFQEYRMYIEGLELKRSSRFKRILTFAKFIHYLDGIGITEIHGAERKNVYDFIESLDGYAPKTLQGHKVILRMILDWLHEEGYIHFSGWDALPVIHDETRRKLMSYYSKEEIGQILSSIDTDSRSGKFAYCAVCFFAYLGMRAGDVIRLRFSDIDWNRGSIRFSQHKTGNPQILPLLDEIRYPLIDYIKNARYQSSDTEHIFITLRAPHKAYANGGVLYNVVEACIEKSGIDSGGRHRGPHTLRHSLATNLMSGDVPVSGISDILGHTSTLTTEIYLTIDEKHLKEVSLEVPNA